MRRRKATRVVTKKMGFNRVVLPLAVLLGLVSLGSVARAQDVTWTGLGASDDWDNSLNWSTLIIPTGTATFGIPVQRPFTSIVFGNPSNSIGEIDVIAGAPAYSFTLSFSMSLVTRRWVAR